MSLTAVGHSYFDVDSGTQLDAWYPDAAIDPNRSCLAEQLGLIEGRPIETTIDDLEAPAVDLADAFWTPVLLLTRPSDTSPTRVVAGCFVSVRIGTPCCVSSCWEAVSLRTSTIRAAAPTN